MARVHVVTHRPTARFDVIAPAGFRILSAIDQATQRCGVDLTITSGTDSHGFMDPHSAGEAFDVSVKGLTPAQVLGVRTALSTILGPRFTVLYETPATPSDPALAAIASVNPKATGPHLHLQKRKGTTYPPSDGSQEI